LMPRASLAWQHAFGTVTPSALLTFQSTGATFGILGVPIARDAALVEAGGDLQLARSRRSASPMSVSSRTVRAIIRSRPISRGGSERAPTAVNCPGCSNPNVSSLFVSSARTPKPWLTAPGLLPPLQPPHMYTIILSVLGQIVQADQDVDFVARRAIASSPMPSHNRTSKRGRR